MVGVPGRSNACHDCRKRRLKCGGERPGCKNCAKSNRLCSGYQRKHAFIFSKDMVAGEPASSETPSNLTHDIDSGAVFASRWRNSSEDKLVPTPPKASSPSQNYDIYVPPPPQGIRQGKLFRVQFLDLFLENYLPAEIINRSRPEVIRDNWLLQIQSLPTLTPALENAILALSISQFGRCHHNETFVQESLSLYTVSLRALRRAVLNPATRSDEQNIAACLALTMYEIRECPGRMIEGYYSHFNGALKLVQLSDAHRYTSGLAHAVFQTLRRHCIFYGLQNRTTTFLVQPEWRELPWNSSNTKDIRDQLIDIALDVPDLFAKGDALDATTDIHERHVKTLEIIRESQRMDSRLSEWFTHLESEVSGPLYYPKLSTIESSADSSELGKLFPVSFHFPTYIVGQSLVFYWVAVIVVHAHMCAMYEKLAQRTTTLETMKEQLPCTCGKVDGSSSTAATICLRHFELEMLPPLGHRRHWAHKTTSNICQSVEYFLQDQLRTVGSVSILLPLVVVKEYWKYTPGNWSRESLWVKDMIARIKSKGEKIAGYV